MDTKDALSVETELPSVTMKRNWYARGKIQDLLRSLGLPVNLDSSHIIVKGIDGLCRWILATSDNEVGSVLFGKKSDKLGEAIEVFTRSASTISVTQIMSPGISLREHGFVLDGCAMRVRFASGNANEGPEAFIVPVEKQMLVNGAEWFEAVALVPKAKLADWVRMMAGAESADRVLESAQLVLRMFNGPDIRIQPMEIDDIIMDDAVKSSFVDDLTGFLSRREWYTDRGLPWTRKFLLNGPPGTGKTSLARWAAGGLGLPALSFDFTDRWADGRTFNAFMSYASRKAPSIIILDDIDKVLGGSNKTGITMHTLLTSFSGMGNLDGIIIVATSNSRQAFRGPMRRRFDAIIEIPLPELGHRKEYLTKLLLQDSISDQTIQSASSMTDGWSFDDLRAAVTASANFMISRGGDNITDADIMRGIEQVSRSIREGDTQE